MIGEQIPDAARARGMTEQQVIDDVLLHAQPPKTFVQIDPVAAMAAFWEHRDASV